MSDRTDNSDTFNIEAALAHKRSLLASYQDTLREARRGHSMFVQFLEREMRTLRKELGYADSPDQSSPRSVQEKP